MTKISVCIATYNGGKYIKEQLDSIFQQLPKDAEVVISDDSSTDNTLQVIDSYNDKRILVHPNQKFRSPIFNFENALKHAKGDFIFLSDQDDIWLPGRLDKMMAFFDEYDMVVSDCKVVNDNLDVISESYFKLVDGKPGFIRNLTRTSAYNGCCMAFKRSLLKRALPFPKHIMMHDFWIALIGELFYKVKFIYEPLVLYRRHSANSSFTGEKTPNSLYRKISFRIKTLSALVFRLLRLA
jgi:glycosyltransferase involved in cell wall biosynthesis